MDSLMILMTLVVDGIGVFDDRFEGRGNSFLRYGLRWEWLGYISFDDGRDDSFDDVWDDCEVVCNDGFLRWGLWWVFALLLLDNDECSTNVDGFDSERFTDKNEPIESS